jgi:ankyrin repeat protein
MKRMEVCFEFLSLLMFYNRVMDSRDQFEAARDGDLQKMRVTLTVDNMNDVDRFGMTALHRAALNGGGTSAPHSVSRWAPM